MVRFSRPQLRERDFPGPDWDLPENRGVPLLPDLQVPVFPSIIFLRRRTQPPGDARKRRYLNFQIELFLANGGYFGRFPGMGVRHKPGKSAQFRENGCKFILNRSLLARFPEITTKAKCAQLGSIGWPIASVFMVLACRSKRTPVLRIRLTSEWGQYPSENGREIQGI
jgi:hypothetical protein